MSGEVGIDARHIQGIAMGARATLVSKHDDVRQIDPPLVAKIQDYRTRGVLPVYRGAEPSTPRVRGSPYKHRQSFDIISKIWRDIRAGRILVCSTRTVSDFDKIMRTPSTLVAKKLPDRTLSTEMRLIADVRLINNFCDKTDYPACENPSLAGLAQRVGLLDRNSPDTPRRVTKIDANEAFRRVATHPDCVSILRTEFPGAELGHLLTSCCFGWHYRSDGQLRRVTANPVIGLLRSFVVRIARCLI